MSSLGSVRKNIRKIAKPPKKERFGVSPAQQLIRLIHADMGIIATAPPHPQKYPEHKDNPEKGSVWRGLCNRTACDQFPATHYNTGTYGYYCAVCAHGINRGQEKSRPICVPVDHSLSHEEMNDLYANQYMKAFHHAA